MTSGHCDAHDGTEWTYGDDSPLGRISLSEQEGANPVFGVAFDPRGKRLAVVRSDAQNPARPGEISLWEWQKTLASPAER